MRRLVSLAAALGLMLSLAVGTTVAATPASIHASGLYDGQIIRYQATAQVTTSPQAAQQISQGNVVYHIVDSTGATPAIQTARLLAALPNVHTDGNVLNFIPTEVGYTGGAWNLQIFHWNAGASPVELSSDTAIDAAVAAGDGYLEVTNVLVRCPVIDFAANR